MSSRKAKPRLLAVYGLLRRRGRFNGLLRKGTFVGEERVSGFVMYHCGDHPRIVRGDGEIVVEIFELADGEFEQSILRQVESGIHDSDHGRYHEEIIEISCGTACIFVCTEIKDGIEVVPSGDWFEV